MRIIDPRPHACPYAAPAPGSGARRLPGRAGAGGPPEAPAPRPIDARFAPYAADPDHPWNRLHQALFVRDAADGGRRVHTTDPLLYEGGTFLLEGESHRRAVTLLDQFLARPGDRPADDPLKRLFLQRDLWAAFDYAAWYPDEWVLPVEGRAGGRRPAQPAGEGDRPPGPHRPRDRRAAGQLRPGGEGEAVRSRLRPEAPRAAVPPAGPVRPGRPVGPVPRGDRASRWPSSTSTGPGGRAAHVVFLRLPAGRAATEQYLKDLTPGSRTWNDPGRDAVKQFPPGTMVAMVRRALAVDAAAKVRVTPVTELVQIRVYRRIPKDPEANFHSDFGEQDVYEFVLGPGEAVRGGERAAGGRPRRAGRGVRAAMVDDPFEEGPRRRRARELDDAAAEDLHRVPPGARRLLRAEHGPGPARARRARASSSARTPGTWRWGTR